MHSSEGTRWFFDSGSLALDFGYTGDYGYGVPAWEHLRGPVDLEAWFAGRFPVPGGAGPLVSPRDLAEALALRAAVWDLARAAADGTEAPPTSIDTLNRFARGLTPAPWLPGGTVPAPVPSAALLLAAVARDAVTVLGTPERIRRCGADDCALIFHDGSRTNARRWCSMQRCGNRHKVRAHRAKTSG